MRIGALIIAAPLFSLMLCAGIHMPSTEARISFTGDIIMHIPVKSCARERNLIDTVTKRSMNNGGFDFLFEKVRDALRSSDIVVGNMEFPVSPPFTSKPFLFNCHPDVLRALKRAGFTMMHLANNHILDQEAKGVEHTLFYLKESGLSSIGVNTSEANARAGMITKAGDVRVGFIGYTGYLNYPYPRKRKSYAINLFYEKERVAEDIAGIRNKCDYLVMIAHTGEEYAPDPLPRDRELMKYYIDQGVDLIVGHHPHLLQPVEKVEAPDGRHCFIFYSLGNFISNQSGSINYLGTAVSTRDSVILTVTLAAMKGVVISRFELEPVITVNRTDKGLRSIQVVAIRDAIKKAREEIGRTPGNAASLEKEIEELKQRAGAVKTALFRGRHFQNIKFLE